LIGTCSPSQRPGLWPGGRSRLKRAYRPGFDPRFSRLSEAGVKGPLIKKMFPPLDLFDDMRYPCECTWWLWPWAVIGFTLHAVELILLMQRTMLE
jgi:hypothetical protein